MWALWQLLFRNQNLGQKQYCFLSETNNLLLFFKNLWFWLAASTPENDFYAMLIVLYGFIHFAGIKCLGVTGPAIK